MHSILTLTLSSNIDLIGTGATSMQVVILAGGYGTRLAEETDLIPKPMVRIGEIPILEHIIRYYAAYGHKRFVIALGYKAEVVHEYFSKLEGLDCEISLVDTGLDTSTGGRVKKLEGILDQQFMLTYGDGLSNVDLDGLIEHHNRHGKIATVTAVRPPARFGSIEIKEELVSKFAEKDPQEAGWINGGFFCLEKEILKYISNEKDSFESEPMNLLVREKQLVAFEHHGWWQPMDTLRDKRLLEKIWLDGNAPWKIL
jgi:glucose-1-phosphate cytidylyltransferase